MRLLPSLLVASVTALASQGLQAQVVISEISFETPAWVELRNNGKTEIDMSKWTLYQATKTPNRSGNYWWGFPTGTKIKPNDYVRVLWGAAVQTSADPRDIYSGDKSFHFLFGHGFEKLNPLTGAMALLNTQDNNKMNSAGIVEDWVQWGESGFPRESLATTASPQLWATGTFLPKQEKDASFALLYDKDANPTPINAFFNDFTPTPLSHNADKFGVSSDLTACGWGNWRKMTLSAASDPIHGNRDFEMLINGTKGPAFFERYTMSFRFDHNKGTIKWWHCDRIDWGGGSFWTMPFLATQTNQTSLKIPILIPGLKGLKLQAQALSFDANSWSWSNRLFVEISN